MRASRALAPSHTAQPPYNLFEREAEKDVVPNGRDNAIATLAYGSLCRGLLSGRVKVGKAFTGDDLRRSDPKFQPARLQQYLRVELLDAFDAKRTASASCISQFAGYSISSHSHRAVGSAASCSAR
jgi:aryl-alcohol dehydrogenase-like predicted oxidoreductase